MTSGGREGPARRSFRAKVERLEALAAGRETSPSPIPRNLKEVRDWSEPDRGLRPWSSFTVATLNGPNGDLRRRLDAALAELSKKASRPDQVRSRTEEHRRTLREVAALAAQNVTLTVEIADLKAEIARRKDLVDILAARERELIDMLNKILPAHQRLRSVSPKP